MFPYRKILELHEDDVSLRGIAMMTRHSRQKVTEVIQLAKKKGVKLPFDDEMTDPWLEDFLYPEKKQEMSGRHLMDFERIHKELGKPNITLTLLHNEYVREAHNAKKNPLMLTAYLLSIITIMPRNTRRRCVLDVSRVRF